MADIEPGGARAVSVSIGDEPEVPELAPEHGDAPDAVTVLPAEDEENALPRRAALQADGSVTLPLLRPVTIRYRSAGQTATTEQTFEELRFQRLTGADMRVISTTDPADRGVVAIARSTGIRPALMHLLFDRMDGADAVAAGDVVAFFLGRGATTGR